MLNFIFGFFSKDVGIDLGTATTLVYVSGKGIVIREPSVVALHKKTKDILAIGQEAKRMVGKTPASIVAVRPLRDGAISDFETTEAMLSYFIDKVHENPQPSLIPVIPRPRVVIGIPSGVTEVERRAVSDAALSAGAREAFLIEEPMAAAIGAGLPIEEPEGSMVIDIGGGTTEIAVISLGGIVVGKSLRIAGDEMDSEIISYIRFRYNVLLGERTAEEAKIAIGSAHPSTGEKEAIVRGRDLETGLPKSIKINSSQVREAIALTLNQIVAATQEVLEDTPPEILADISETGIVLAGGGALLPGLAKLLAQETKMPVVLAKDPITAVVYGCGKVLEDLELLEKVKITGGLS
jgi:rod shape-determining protein MreB